jgi:hypothetical protein
MAGTLPEQSASGVHSLTYTTGICILI